VTRASSRGMRHVSTKYFMEQELCIEKAWHVYPSISSK